MSGHEEHPPGCFVSVSVRFAKPNEIPMPIALAGSVIAAIIAECVKVNASPNGLINVAIGPGSELLGLWEKVSAGEATNVATVGAFDQAAATFKAEPRRFAALAFAHILPQPVQP